MTRSDLETRNSPAQDQETANASSSATNTVAATKNCEATTEQIATVGNIENDNSSDHKSGEICSSQNLKIFAPVITQDVTLPNTTKKVPMVMVPVPDSHTLMAIPVSALSQLKETQMDASKNEQQARDLLSWNDGIGTLDGCDLRFKINQLGCLELLDSDDELENQCTLRQSAISMNSNQFNNNSNNNNNTKNSVNNKSSSVTKTIAGTKTITNAPNLITTTTTNATTTNGLSDTPSTNDKFHKKAKMELGTAPAKQISPGSSLLRDGPNMRRPKSSSSNYATNNSRAPSNSLSLLKKIEHHQNSILLDKLIPKQKLDEIKSNVEKWSVEDVKNFVDSIPGCAGYGELFESQQICGKSLLYLDQRDLLDVINIKLGPAVKIYHAISLLK